MASVSGVNSSNASSIYGSRNVFTGLATGMDTESMIENAISGYKTKINGLLQRQTKLSWKQEAYRNVIDPMVQYTRKYTSYTSATNLMSRSYFNKAVNTTTNGENAGKISASGKTTSDIQVLGIKQLATASTYRVSGSVLDTNSVAGVNANPAATAANALDLSGNVKQSLVEGTMTLQYGGSVYKTVDLAFDADEVYESGQAFVNAINKKLGEQNYVLSDGSTVKANTVMQAELKDGKITFKDLRNAGNTVSVQSATGKLKDTLNIVNKDINIKLPTYDSANGAGLYETMSGGKALAGKTLTFNVDGKIKTITLNDKGYDPSEYTDIKDDAGNVTKSAKQQAMDALVSDINSKLSGFGGVTAEVKDGKLNFTGKRGSTISVTAPKGAAGEALGFTGSAATSYLNVNQKLSDMKADGKSILDDFTTHQIKVDEKEIIKRYNASAKGDDKFTYEDKDGNALDKDGYRIDANGNRQSFYDLTINGKTLSFTEDTTLESVISAINSDTDIGLNASFSKTTNSITFTSQETGTDGRIDIEEGDLAARLFGATKVAITTPDLDDDGKSSIVQNRPEGYTQGQDAILSVKINGEVIDDMRRTDNSFELDGLTLNLKGTFGEYEADKDENGETTYKLTDESKNSTEAVTFTTRSDADKIVKDVTSMVDDLNNILKMVHDGYATQPNRDSKQNTYEPLTSDDEEGMSDADIERYNEKAKVGILFGDRDLSSLYSRLLDDLDSTTLSKIGITTSYSNGQTTLAVDEEKLRSALENDPDSVRDAFTDTRTGLMTNIKSTMDMYANTSSGSPGILVSTAGTQYASNSLLDNTLLKQMNELDDQIDKWQTRMSDKVDYYTRQFSLLEQLTAQMNNQSSMLAGLMTGNG